MIYESIYWKEELFRNAKWLVDSLTKKRWTERGLGKIEKCVMLSAYSIRKLGESKKIPDEYFEHKISIYAFPISEPITNDFVYRIGDHYNFINKNVIKLKISYIFNQIIHSFIFIPFFEHDVLTGILFNSDKSKDKYLYFVDIKVLIDMFMYISNGDIVSATCKRENGNLIMTNVVFKSTLDLASIGSD